MDIKQVAAQLYTVRDFTKTPEDIRKTMKRVRGIGYEAVQVSAIGQIDPAELKEIVDELGIHICATHIPFERLRNDTANVIKEHKLWGCNYVGLGSMPVKYRSSEEGFRTFIDEISEIGREIADSGLRFIYHNHKFEFQKFNEITGMELLLNETDPKEFEFEIDTYWVQAGGANPVNWIEKVEGRMGVVHLKDMAIVDDQQVFAEVGEGNLDWPEILKACNKIGVKWYAIEQDTCLRDPFESLAISYNNMIKLIKEYKIS